ncbi:MAG: hypothetical protein L0206_20320 [Actinobacteria bacterium]|nr:hypothetical protein [Actinomycetota bacterium]
MFETELREHRIQSKECHEALMARFDDLTPEQSTRRSGTLMLTLDPASATEAAKLIMYIGALVAAIAGAVAGTNLATLPDEIEVPVPVPVPVIPTPTE